MELFKIIKKAFDLVRNEVAQALSDSKSHAQKLVDAEATRTNIVIEDLEKRVNSDLRSKVSSTLYIKTNDISNEGELSGTIDAEFLEWNILRRVYTKGVVGKTTGTLQFYSNEDGIVRKKTISKHSFFNLPYLWRLSGDSGGAKSLYNVEVDNENYNNLFADVIAYYISCKNLADLPMNCARMFNNCTRLKYIDFSIPSQGTSHDYIFNNCYNLVHTNFEINWPNSTSAKYAFNENETMRNDANSKLNVTLPVATDVTNMFNYCKKLRYVNNFYAPQAEGYGLFAVCESLESISGTIEFMGGGSLDNMFISCKKLRSPINIIIPNELVYGVNNMFNGCVSLIDAPSLSGTIGVAMDFFRGCSSLKSIPLYKFADGIALQNAFEGCASLTDLGGFDGLTMSLRLADSPLLSRESCLNLFNYAGTVETTSNRAFSINATAYRRLSEEDIAIAVNKGWKVYSA